MTPKSPAPIDSAKVEDTGEPVAWMYVSSRGTDVTIKRFDKVIRDMCPADLVETPLYAAPRLPNTTSSTQAVEDTGEPWQVGDDTSSVQISRDGSTHKWGCKCEGCAPTTGSAPVPDAKADMKEGRWCPDECPITSMRFFMWIGHPDLGYVPTYGGPFDSYTIAEPDEDGYYRAERYDHDAGGWIDGGEPVHVRDELTVTAEIEDAAPASPAASVLTDDKELLDFLEREENPVDTIYLDNHTIIDVAGRKTVRQAIRDAILAASMGGDRS